MKNLKSQVVFANAYYHPLFLWWTYAGLVANNTYALIFIDFRPGLRINLGEELINSLKKSLSQEKSPYSLPILQKIVKKFTSSCGDKFSLSLVLVSIKSNDSQNIINLCGNEGLICQINTPSGSFLLPVLENGVSGQIDSKSQIILTNNYSYQNFLKSKIHPALNFNNIQKIALNSKYPINLLQLKNEPLSIPLINSLKNQIKNLKNLKAKKHLPQIKIDLNEKKKNLLSKKRWYALITAATFLLLLGFSIGFGSYKKQKENQKQAEQALVEEVTYRLEQAQSLKELNPARAKTLLKEAKQTLETYQKQNKTELNLQELGQKVSSAYALVSQEIYIENPEVFYNLSLVKEEFLPQFAALIDSDLTLLDPSSESVVNLNIQSKAAKILLGKSDIKNNKFLGANDSWIFLASQNSIQVIDKSTQKELDTFSLSKINIHQFLGYGSNAYVLDKDLNQIWRFRGTQKTLSSPEKFFSKEQELKNISSLALDGSVWLLRDDGGVEKYTSGIKDAYYPSFDLDLPLNHPQKIYTDEYCKNLYILDKANKRIVAISKNGEYKSQYIWEDITKSQDFVVSENIGKILILIGEKIYGIDLQK
jgi:hypothetical protein